MRQLTKIVLSETSGSSDEQAAAPDEGGSYGELMDAIDGFLEQISPEERQANPMGCARQYRQADHYTPDPSL